MKLIIVLVFTLTMYTDNSSLLDGSTNGLSERICQEGIVPIIDGFSGRKITKMPTIIFDQKGIISTTICISSKGIVSYVGINDKETTIKEKPVLKSFLKTLRQFEFESKPIKEECGTVTFKNL